MTEETDTSIAKVSQIHSLTADFLKKRLSERGFDDFASSHGYILYQLNINKSTTTVLVRKLEQAGLVKVSVDENDKRNRILSLTPKGAEYNQMTQELSQELLATFYKGFDEQEKEEFCRFLDRIKRNF